jgi:DNA-binding transcriptional LysR family regulator
MDLSQLEAFLSVCQTLNFTKSSEHLHISQSAVTARIKALESSIGKVLFLRDNRNVSLDEIILVSAEEGRLVSKADFFSQKYCHIEWGTPFPEWFSNIVGPGYIPALQTDHSTIMLTLLLQGSVFGFLPRSVAQPFLDAHKLFRPQYDIQTPIIRVYASYLTEKSEDASVRLGLNMLGIPDIGF